MTAAALGLVEEQKSFADHLVSQKSFADHLVSQLMNSTAVTLYRRAAKHGHGFSAYTLTNWYIRRHDYIQARPLSKRALRSGFRSGFQLAIQQLRFAPKDDIDAF